MKLTVNQLNLGYLEHSFGALRTVTLQRTAPGCDYVVTVLNGLGENLARRANFSTVTPARRFAKAVLRDLTAPATGGVDTL